MRSFIVAIIVLAVVVLFVFGNSFYVTGIYDDIISDTKNLPQSVYDENAESLINALCDKVEKRSSYLFLVLPQQSVNELLYCVSDIRSAESSKDENTYRSSTMKVLLTLELMKKNEGMPFAMGKSKKRYFP